MELSEVCAGGRWEIGCCGLTYILLLVHDQINPQRIVHSHPEYCVNQGWYHFGVNTHCYVIATYSNVSVFVLHCRCHYKKDWEERLNISDMSWEIPHIYEIFSCEIRLPFITMKYSRSLIFTQPCSNYCLGIDPGNISLSLPSIPMDKFCSAWHLFSCLYS